eukprot:CAMPEP_0204916120 /NCGR_PEP_ID=MMETSP1397-20131031/14016_1 /ASSEMBLY_ACC=CAM_ASM_000891 /TAXON_ID=49980 /ORGANISM="Climacostomum Climacostomum virens, Strain Stock W-24" /LENGTH=129 /DNA_ID=CAMNT_0052088505 /DNA_START=71 /DNA_END=457 /DNA_ORIENTATION=+
MDLNYVTESNPAWLSYLESEGYDMEALLCICEGLFQVTDEVGLSTGEVGEFFFRLKIWHDKTLEKEPQPQLVLYENSRGSASRLCFEERTTGRNFLFRLVPVLGRGDESFYKCESCTGSVSVLKADARK